MCMLVSFNVESCHRLNAKCISRLVVTVDLLIYTLHLHLDMLQRRKQILLY